MKNKQVIISKKTIVIKAVNNIFGLTSLILTLLIFKTYLHIFI